MLLVLALLSAFCAQLNFRRAPDARFWWQLTVVTTEFGHLLVLLPLGVALLAWRAEAGEVRVVTLCLCAFAGVGFLRPSFLAWRLARTLPARQTAAFAYSGGTPAPFSAARLFFHLPPPRAAVRTEVFARHEGEELALDFYPAQAAGPVPCLVVIHGGGWDSGDRAQLAGWNHRWAARGYAVAAISYRLAPRWQWPAQSDDVRSALAWLKAQAPRLGLDPTRLVLLGRSAGGQIATAVGYGLRDPAIRGVVALYAPHDMPFVWSVSREGDALNSAKLMRQYMGGPPEDVNRERYHTASGQLLAEAGSPPTLLAHGTKDTLSWERHSARLTARLAELSVGHFYLQLPWGTHGFDFNPDGPGGQLASYSIERFLDAVMRRGAAAPRVGG